MFLFFFPQNKTEDFIYLALESTSVSEALGRNEFKWIKGSWTLRGQLGYLEFDRS